MNETKTFKLGAVEKAAYASGQLSYAMQNNIIAMYSVLFLTTALGLDPVKVGVMSLATRFIDAFTDIIFSLIGDRTKTKIGSYRPWFIVFMFISTIFIGMFFHVPGQIMSDTTKTWVWVVVTYIVSTCICQTVSGVSVGAMGILVSPNAEDRKTLGILRQWGTQAASLILYVAAMPILLAFSANKEVPDAGGFHVLGWIMAGISFITALFFAVKVKERVPVNVTTDKVPISKSLKGLAKNNIAWGCMIIQIACVFMIGLTGGMNSYIFIYVFKNPGAMALSATVAMIISLFSTTFVVPMITKRLSRWQSFLIGVIGEVIVGILFWVASGMGSIILHTIAYALFTAFNSMIGAINFQCMPDANTYGEYLCGYSIPGMVNSVISFAQKVALGLSSFVMASMLTLIHFDNALGANQTAETVRGIRIVSAGAVICMMVVILIGMIVINRTKPERLEEIKKELDVRHASSTDA